MLRQIIGNRENSWGLTCGTQRGVEGSSGEINNYELVQRKFQALSNCQGLGKVGESQEKMRHNDKLTRAEWEGFGVP